MKITAIDFETANHNPDSACSLAMVSIEDGNITSAREFLIRPPDSYFRFSAIHGITWEDVHDQPDFSDRIPQIESFLSDTHLLVAHNAHFDRRVLLSCYTYAQHRCPPIPFSCSIKVAKQVWRLDSYRLPVVCEHLGIALNHHEALSDAQACAEIIIAADKAGIRAKAGMI